MTAILKSEQGIATRRRVVKRTKLGREICDYEMAFATQKGQAFIYNGRTGKLRRPMSADLMTDTWNPFQLGTPRVMQIRVKREKKEETE